MSFATRDGLAVPSVTAAQMREVDRIAVEDFGLGVLQMMENAGRNLAQNAMAMLATAQRPAELERAQWVTILAGSGGNGGGGLCCARHLHNRGLPVSVVLSKEAGDVIGPAAVQLQVLQTAGVEPVQADEAEEAIRRAALVIDALIGYSLRGAPSGRVAELIDLCNTHAERVLSLDLPSGLDATTGEAPGVLVQPERTLTLALPKTGLEDVRGELYLADIGIPAQVYLGLGFHFEWPSRQRYWIPLEAEVSAPRAGW
ncbi:MAG: NAD(P)H-hydrate epimerase [Anaerolineae bacterium]|jgi:NAD(P)H-hydrate epimerase